MTGGVMWSDVSQSYCEYPEVDYFSIVTYPDVFYSSCATVIWQQL